MTAPKFQLNPPVSRNLKAIVSFGSTKISRFRAIASESAQLEIRVADSIENPLDEIPPTENQRTYLMSE